MVPIGNTSAQSNTRPEKHIVSMANNKTQTDALKDAMKAAGLIGTSDLLKNFKTPSDSVRDVITSIGLLGWHSHETNSPKVERSLQAERIVITTPVELGQLIKSSRIAKKLTQQQLADLAGVGRRFIVECEAGKPRLEFAKVLQVAAAAGIDILAIKR